MRLRRWLVLLVSAGVFLAIAAIGLQMNHAALDSAESIHRRDSAALVKNNATLASQYMALSAKELRDFAVSHPFLMQARDPHDAALLADFRQKAFFFPHGAALLNASGGLLNAVSQPPGLPPADDPGYGPVRAGLQAGQPGVSAVMFVQGIPMIAVAIPVSVEGRPAGFLVGFTTLGASHLQDYVSEVGSGSADTIIVDGSGIAVASNRRILIGTRVPSVVTAAVKRANASQPLFVEYDRGGTTRIAVIQGGMRGGWSNIHDQTLWDFYGPTRSTSLNINLVLLGMVLVAGVALTMTNHRAETLRRRSERRFRALIQHASDLFTVLGPDLRVRYDSPSVRGVLGFEPGGRDGTKAVETVHPADRDAAKAAFAQVMADPAAVARLQCRISHADGGYRWVDLSVSNLLTNDSVHGIVVNARDITDSRRLQEQMSHQALHDALTGLPNRRLFYERLEHTDERRRRGGSEDLALVFVDLDGFKPVNDTLGHDAGDELLRQVSHRFKACLRTGDTLARVGGDEFAVLLDELAGPEDAVAVADRIVASLHAPFAIHGENVWIGASVGVAPVEAGSDPHQAMRAADTAMYRAKQAGGHQFVLSQHGPDRGGLRLPATAPELSAGR
ncbi:MAG: y4lL-like uncharacterized protein [Actinomycetia bacterium]|nr:y4lL-like uncharacterized protein [Actinomycetes bacterium]MDQ1656476.1 hypothetical protein [Cryptosporangiaceae bacterium]